MTIHNTIRIQPPSLLLPPLPSLPSLVSMNVCNETSLELLGSQNHQNLAQKAATHAYRQSRESDRYESVHSFIHSLISPSCISQRKRVVCVAVPVRRQGRAFRKQNQVIPSSRIKSSHLENQDGFLSLHSNCRAISGEPKHCRISQFRVMRHSSKLGLDSLVWCR